MKYLKMLSASDREAIAAALNMRINYIETGNPLFNRNDALAKNAATIVNQGAERITDPQTRAMLIEIKTLQPEQVKLVARLTELRDACQ